MIEISGPFRAGWAPSQTRSPPFSLEKGIGLAKGTDGRRVGPRSMPTRGMSDNMTFISNMTPANINKAINTSPPSVTYKTYSFTPNIGFLAADSLSDGKAWLISA